jgi:hypothetical protein
MELKPSGFGFLANEGFNLIISMANEMCPADAAMCKGAHQIAPIQNHCFSLLEH